MCIITIHRTLLLFCIFSVIFAEIFHTPGFKNYKTITPTLRFGKRSHTDPSWLTHLRLSRMRSVLTTHPYQRSNLNDFFMKNGVRPVKREDINAVKSPSSKALHYLRVGRSL